MTSRRPSRSVLAWLSVVAIFLGCTSIAVGAQSKVEANKSVIEAIEAQLTLPEGAFDLDEYSRNYARDEDGKVIAVYRIPSSLPSPRDGCSVVGADKVMRPCSEEVLAKTEAMLASMRAQEGVAGTSRWLESVDELPFVLDGGCSVVNLIYDQSANQIEEIWCNGLA